MAEDVILEAGATINVEPYQAGLDKMVSSTQQAAAGVKDSFGSIVAADTAVIQSVQNIGNQTAASFANVRTGGILAFDAVRAKMIESTVEVARLRNEIVATDDPAALAKLRAQLREATLAMTAARTEMRALRFEAAEATEKASLLGEAMGVRLPGELGKLIGRMPAVQTAMAAAFQVTIVLFFIQMLQEGIEKFSELIEEAGGFGKAAQEAFQKAVEYNQRLIDKNLEMKDKMAEIGTIGKEGAVKAAAEARNAAESTARWSEANAENIRKLNETNIEVEKFKSKTEGFLGTRFWISWSEGIIDYKKRLEEATKEQERLTKETQETTEKLQFTKVEEEARRTAEERKRISEESIADSIARTSELKSIETSYVDFYLAGVKRMFGAGKINLEEEINDERAAVNAKLQIERDYAAAREAELRRKGATGQNVTPELEANRAQLERAEITARQSILDLDARFDKETIDHANSVSLALAEAHRKSVDLEASAVEASARRQLEERKISIDQETTILKNELTKRLDAERDTLQEELRIAQQHPYQDAAKIASVNSQLLDIERKRVNDENALDEEAFRRRQEEERRQAEEEIRFTRETSNLVLESTRRTDEERLKSHAIGLSEWEASERAALDRWYSTQRGTYEKAAADAARLFGVQSLEYRRVLNDMMILDEKFASESQRIDEKLAQQFQQTMNVISRSFSSAFDRMLTEHTKFRSVMVSFWDQMVQGWARMGLQIVANYVQTLAQILLQEILTALRINIVHSQASTVKKATETAFDAFLNALGIKRAAQQGSQDAAIAGKQATYETQRITAESAFTGKYIADQVAMTTAFDTAVAQRAGAQVAANATVNAADSAAAVGKVEQDTAVAAADVFLQAIESIPFPANLAAAPAAAATVQAEMAPFAAQAAAGGAVGVAEKGGVLHADMMVAAHAKEMILPANLSTGLQNVINTGAVAAPEIPAALSSPAPGNTSTSSITSNSKTFHISPQISVSNIGGGKMSEADIADAVHVGIRRGLINLRGAL